MARRLVPTLLVLTLAPKSALAAPADTAIGMPIAIAGPVLEVARIVVATLAPFTTGTPEETGLDVDLFGGAGSMRSRDSGLGEALDTEEGRVHVTMSKGEERGPNRGADYG